MQTLPDGGHGMRQKWHAADCTSPVTQSPHAHFSKHLFIIKSLKCYCFYKSSLLLKFCFLNGINLQQLIMSNLFLDPLKVYYLNFLYTYEQRPIQLWTQLFVVMGKRTLISDTVTGRRAYRKLSLLPSSPTVVEQSFRIMRLIPLRSLDP